MVDPGLRTLALDGDTAALVVGQVTVEGGDHPPDAQPYYERILRIARLSLST